MERAEEPPCAGQETYVLVSLSCIETPNVCVIVMRLGKPMEHAQAAMRAALAPGAPAEQITTIGRQLSYFGYLFHDTLVWVCPQARGINDILLELGLGKCRQVL